MLRPYKVLDFTDERGEIGPMLLGDLGATVTRVEPPQGSAARSVGPWVQDSSGHRHSLQFAAFNRNKRSVMLDPDSETDRKSLQELVRRTDFLFESAPQSLLAAYGLDFEQLRAINPRIVHVCISPFGTTGPHANYLGNDLVIAAMAGPVSVQGVPERAPVRLSVPQVWRHAGVEAAAGAMVAHQRMLRTNTAQFVDLSAQCVMTWTMLNAMDAHAIQGFDFERAGSVLSSGASEIQLVHPAADGYLVALPMSAVILGCESLMIADGLIDSKTLKDIDWEAYDMGVRDPAIEGFNLAQATALLRRFFALHTKQELYEFGLQKGITLAPVNTLAELLAFQHMDVREYWHDMELPNGQSVRSPGLWAKHGHKSLGIRSPAPKLDEHGAAVRAELTQPAVAKDSTHDGPRDGSSDDAYLPFDGVKVADFSWVGVGPISGKYLADHGARVIRVESENRPDVLRGGVPAKDAQLGINRSQFFGDFNTSKQSLNLDMKSPEALELAKQLIQRCDVLIESFAPGVIGRMGLGYEEARKLNPGLIMISTCLMGQTGPAANLAGYGYHAAAIAGFYDVIGWPDLPPVGPWVAYTDTIAPRFVSVLLSSALDHRRRTGEGCYIDVAQIETALHFLGPEFLDLQANGVAAARIGNRSVRHAPQGCYCCEGTDQWCAIAVETDAQWQLLCQEMGREDWCNKTEFMSNQGRIAEHDAIDAGIQAWTLSQTPQAVMQRLQAVGVPAGMVQRSSDLIADPQYAHRQFYRYFDHPEMGHIPYAGHQYRVSGYDNGPRGPAPLLGQHSFEILSEMLGLDDEAVAKAYASGALN